MADELKKGDKVEWGTSQGKNQRHGQEKIDFRNAN